MFLLLAVALYGARYAVRCARAPAPPSIKDGAPLHAVDRLSGRGWSLVALDSSGPLRVVDLDDPSVDVETDVALGLHDRDVN